MTKAETMCSILETVSDECERTSKLAELLGPLCELHKKSLNKEQQNVFVQICDVAENLLCTKFDSGVAAGIAIANDLHTMMNDPLGALNELDSECGSIESVFKDAFKLIREEQEQ